jgi:hypothetical protein
MSLHWYDTLNQPLRKNCATIELPLEGPTSLTTIVTSTSPCVEMALLVEGLSLVIVIGHISKQIFMTS